MNSNNRQEHQWFVDDEQEKRQRQDRATKAKTGAHKTAPGKDKPNQHVLIPK